MNEERMKTLNDFIKNLTKEERFAELTNLQHYINKIKEKQLTT